MKPIIGLAALALLAAACGGSPSSPGPGGSSTAGGPADSQLLAFAHCVRSHGVPDWPDPTTDSQGRPVFDLGRAGITQGEARSSQITTKVSQCQHLLPPNLGGIPIGGS